MIIKMAIKSEKIGSIIASARIILLPTVDEKTDVPVAELTIPSRILNLFNQN